LPRLRYSAMIVLPGYRMPTNKGLSGPG
jgi:hypothetical protein